MKHTVDNLKDHDHNLCMTLSKLLKEEMVLLKTPCASRDELIDKLVERVYSTNRELPFPQKDVRNIVYTREKIGGTLLPSGLSVPHARLKDFDGFILAVGTTAEPLFHEGLQIHMMALMITSQSGAPWYLTTLAALTKISRDGEYFSRLCGAEDTDSFFRILRERDPELA